MRDEYNLFESASAFNTDLFGIARTLVRMSDEDQKPNAERLPEYTAAGRESLEQRSSLQRRSTTIWKRLSSPIRSACFSK